MKPDPALLVAAYCRDAGLPAPVREYRFAAPVRDWSFDLAWPELRVALEVEGGLFGRGKRCPTCQRAGVGAHSSIKDLLDDLEKYNEAAIRGWRLIRATPDRVRDGVALGWLYRALTRGT